MGGNTGKTESGGSVPRSNILDDMEEDDAEQGGLGESTNGQNTKASDKKNREKIKFYKKKISELVTA